MIIRILGLLIGIVIGGISGWIAGKIMKVENSVLINVILGIVGGFVGNLVLTICGIKLGGPVGSILVAVFGACILIALGKYFLKKR